MPIVRNQNKKKIDRTSLVSGMLTCMSISSRLLITSHYLPFCDIDIFNGSSCVARLFILSWLSHKEKTKENYLRVHNRYMMTRNIVVIIIIIILFVFLMIEDRVSSNINLLTTTVRWYYVQFY
jgi:hypothetical protein